MMYSIKNLDETGLGKIKSLESKMGVCIVAVENAPKPAAISEEQIKELQSAEKEMGAILVAYKCN